MAVMMTGTVLTVTYNEEVKQVGHLRSISEIKMDSDMVDVTTLDADMGFRQYEKGLRQAGDVTLDGFMEKGDAAQETLRSLYLNADSALFDITYPDGEKVQFSGLVKGLNMGGGEVDDVVKFGVTVRITGPVYFA